MDFNDLDIVDVEPSAPTINGSINNSNNLKQFLPWVEKYRPGTLDELISHDQIINTLRKLINSGQMPHLLFYGPPGTGKTSTILSISKTLNGKDYKSMTLELNASDDRNIRIVREEIKDFASTKKIYGQGQKLIILDEADAITNDAQAALRRIIEKYTKNTRFCLICNHVNKISSAIQSRCTKFRFGPLDEKKIAPRLDYVIEQEKVKIDSSGIDAILRLSAGDMRKVLNILQACHMAFPDGIDENSVYLCTGSPLPSDVRNIVETMLNMDFKVCFDSIMEMKISKGYALQDLITEIYSLVKCMKLDNQTRISLTQKMADIEYRIASGTSERIQLSSLISAFILVRAEMDVY